jgi:uncharacterized protein YxeA
MKKYLLGIFALILAIGMSSFTAPARTATGGEFDYVLESDPNDMFTGTRDEAVIHYGCNLGTVICAKAYVPGTQTHVETEDLWKN